MLFKDHWECDACELKILRRMTCPLCDLSEIENFLYREPVTKTIRWLKTFKKTKSVSKLDTKDFSLIKR